MIFLFALLLILVNTINGSDWDYGKHGPDVWKEISPNCGGQQQSPINILTACTTPETYSRFAFSSVHNEKLTFNLTNNGHTITATPTSSPIILLAGGGLKGEYRFQSFHIHWGPNHNSGSEHQINGDKSAGESHFVYSQTETGRMAVLSFLMETKQTDINTAYQSKSPRNVKTVQQWQDYFYVAHQLKMKNNSTKIDLTLSILMEANLNDFWRYEGSLTTPPCDEVVTWTVFKQRILIDDYDFEAFRDDLFFESYRGPQPWYYRKVYRSFLTEEKSPIPDQNACPPIKSEAALSFDIFQTRVISFFFNIFLSYGLFYSN